MKKQKAPQTQSAPSSVNLDVYSSPSIFARAYIPNPAIPSDRRNAAETFSIVTYNILAECFRVQDDVYSYTPPEYLCQEYRHILLMKELDYLNGDIVCLQEVNPKYVLDSLCPDMAKLGYEMLDMLNQYSETTNAEPATFYKKSVFDQARHSGVWLTSLAHKALDSNNDLSSEEKEAAERYVDRPAVALISQLRHRATDKIVTVGNLHVTWTEDVDVQCLQAALSVRELLETTGGEDAPHILCGDFNDAHLQKPVTHLITEQYLSIDALQAVEGLAPYLKKGSSLVALDQKLFENPDRHLDSAYKSVTGQDPPLTCFTDRVWPVLDYIFFSTNALQAEGVLQTVNKDAVVATGGLPCKHFPSDHLSLKAVFSFK